MKENKLTTKDLMIGDWVIINNIPRQVTFIDDCINYKIMATGKHPDGGKISFVGELNEEVKPIPLTPEILEKNGFVKNRGITSWKFETNREDLVDIYGVNDYHLSINIEDTHGSGKGYRWMLNNLVIFYVHELQHAFRLCGIEKEIEL